jgi:hypothetical protein
MIEEENKKLLSEETPSGAMGSGSYLTTSLNNPSDPNAVYVAFRNGKCKTFNCPIERRKFLDENKDWVLAENDDDELTLEEKLFWEEIGTLYLDENMSEVEDEDLNELVDNDVEIGDEDNVNERVIKTLVKTNKKKYYRLSSTKPGYKVVKDKKSGLTHEVKISLSEIKKRKNRAKLAKKYYKKNKKKKLIYMKKRR